MKHILFKSMSLCLLMVHCMVPAAEPGAAARALSSSSPAPAKSAARAGLARIPASRADQEEVFQSACKRDDIDVARRLLDGGFDVNSRITTLDGALVFAYEDDVAIPIGAPATNFTGATPLHIAADTNALKIMALLLERGADVHARIEDEQDNSREATAYKFAFDHGHYKAVDLLLRAGASKDLTALRSRSLQLKLKKWPKDKLDIMLADLLSFQVPKIFKVLQDNGAIDEGVCAAIDLKKILGDQSSVSQLAIRKRNDELAKMFAEGRVSQDDLMRRDKTGMNVLLWVSSFGNVPAMRLCMERGKHLPLTLPSRAPVSGDPQREQPIPFNPFCRDEFGSSALTLAQRHKDAMMVNAIHDGNAPIRRGIISLVAHKDPRVPAAVSNLVGEMLYGGRYVARLAPVAGLLESPRAAGGAAVAAAAEKVESKAVKEFAKKD